MFEVKVPSKKLSCANEEEENLGLLLTSGLQAC